MKNLLYILVSVFIMTFLSSCTAEELPETNPSFQMETVDPNPPAETETEPPVVIVPPTKKP